MSYTPAKATLQPLAHGTTLLPGDLLTHRQRNIAYLMGLKVDNLLLPYRFEAGLISFPRKVEDCHWGWDSPLSDLRGQFTGHWLSAAARLIQATDHAELRLKADAIIDELTRCQEENGGEWFFPIPEKHLLWLKRGKHTWAPQYVCHKCMAGLLDMYRYAKNEKALSVLKKAAHWFTRFTADIPRTLMDDMMDWEETGGMMELWADLYAITKDEAHLALMRAYERPCLYEPLLRGDDALTNMHANTTIPEILGAARAYEVTGEERYLSIVQAYWDWAVERRGMYVTGGQTCGEVWAPPGRQAPRLGSKNQEHCVVYHMMRLSEALLRWTGEATYADYYERNLLNGVLSQTFFEEKLNTDTACHASHPDRSPVAYYQGLGAGSHKLWGSETEHFWCCHGTAVQANAALEDGLLYTDEEGLVLCQYQNASTTGTWNGLSFQLETKLDPFSREGLSIHPIHREVQKRPDAIRIVIRINAENPIRMTLKIRKPWWLAGDASLTVNGTPVEMAVNAKSFFTLTSTFSSDEFVLTLPKALTCQPLADDPQTVAFLDGPIALAGLCSEEMLLFGDISNPTTLLQPDNEREWQNWLPTWRTSRQPRGIRFVPISQIGREAYTVYFPVSSEAR